MIFENEDREGTAEDLDLVDAYDYELPDALIAAHPAEQRAASRLLVANRADRSIHHHQFDEIGDFLEPGDLLVFNNARVIPARMHARKQTGGAVELLVLDVASPTGASRWTEPAGGRLELRCMTRSSRPLRQGMVLSLDGFPDAPDVHVDSWDAGRADVHLTWDAAPSSFFDEFGEMPLPPYILKRRGELGEPEQASEDDRERYQTVYASRPGAVAAPTAGLHFTPELLDGLEARGIETAQVTLRVGPGTFRPVNSDRLRDHDMHSEEYEISGELASAVLSAKEEGRRVVAVGTTSTRALEAEARRESPFQPGSRRTSLFLKPGASFEVVDALITNFHLPRSTLLALVAAFAGYDLMRRIYATAVDEQYRFYSYGDSMLIK